MGNCCCHHEKEPCIKYGSLYNDIKQNIRPLDLLVFKGDDFVSGIISLLEKRGHKFAKGGDFTHAGIVITSEILDEPLLQPGKLYIMEATISGNLGAGVPDIHGRSFLGVQIRDLERLIDAYDYPNTTAIAWCSLTDNPCQTTEIKQRFNQIYNQINGVMWDANCWNLLSALYPCMRPCRPCFDHTLHTEKWLFCSEMVAVVYKHLGILPDYVNPSDVLPADLVFPNEDTDRMPSIINNITYITSLRHHNHKM